jgi:glycosyltransferase involved in cell wall biosynthesis
VTTDNPHVSVCIPAFNAEQWIERAVRSVLVQTYEDFELIVVDDASTDGTLERVLEIDDSRTRAFSNLCNLGQSRNWNRAISLARGDLLKFLCADDVLYPDCLDAMVPLFSDPHVGLVFSRRDVEAEDADSAAKWQAKYSSAHERFGDLTEVNRGRLLIDKWLASGFDGNWIGGPTSVMMSRPCFDRIGGFNVRVHQRVDMDLWIRALFFFDAGFIDRCLARRTLRSGSVSDINQTTGQSWLDQPWILEGLLDYDELRDYWPEIRALRRRAARKVISHALRSAASADSQKLGDLARYLAARVRRPHRDQFYGSVSDQGSRGETIEHRVASTAGS